MHAAGLGPSLRRDAVVILVGIVDCQLGVTGLLDGLVIEAVVPLAIDLDWRSDVLADNLATLLDLLRVKRRSHVQILFLSGSRVRTDVVVAAGLIDNRLVGVLFEIGSESHLTFEFVLCLLVTFLSVLQFLVPPVNQVITRRNVVVAVVLDAFDGVLAIEIEFLDNFGEQLLLNGHLFLARE